MAVLPRGVSFVCADSIFKMLSAVSAASIFNYIVSFHDLKCCIIFDVFFKKAISDIVIIQSQVLNCTKFYPNNYFFCATMYMAKKKRGGCGMKKKELRGRVCISFDGKTIHRYVWFNEQFHRLTDSTAEKEILSLLEKDKESMQRMFDDISSRASIINDVLLGLVSPGQVNDVVNTALNYTYDLIGEDSILGCLMYGDILHAIALHDDGSAMYYVNIMKNVSRSMKEPLEVYKLLYCLLHDAMAYDEPNKWFSERVLAHEQLFDRHYTSEFINYDLIDGSTKLDLYYTFDNVADYYIFMLLRFAQENKRVSLCRCCGNFFVPRTKHRTVYCDRVFTEDGKTCKQVAPKLMQKLRRKKDELLDEYDRVRNKNYKRFERGSWKLDGQQTEKDLSYEEYADWADEARAARAAYIRGELGKDEFREVIERLG